MARGWLLAIMFTTALVPPATAQDTPGQDPGLGLWLGAGFGAGLGKVGCDVCRGEWEFAPSAQVSFGGTVSSILRIGVEGNGWLRNDSVFGVRDIMVGIGAVVYWYPRPGRYYVKAGFGPLFYRTEDAEVAEGDEPDPPITSTAFSGHLGVGYELRRGRFAFVPFFNVTASMYGDLTQGDSRLTDVGLSLMQLGLAVRWQ